MTLDFNQRVIEEFRANGGRVGGPFEDARLILLTTTGARSGQPHTVPLGCLPDGERSLVIASAAGAPRHPAWYHNLRTRPRVTVEDGAFRYPADAVVLESEERDRLFARAVEADPGWAEYQGKTSRVLPVVALRPAPGPPRPTGDTLGAFLLGSHDGIRRELALIRKEAAGSGRTLGGQLRMNCLTLCLGLGQHHQGEDVGLFHLVAERRPDLAPILERLRAEHERLAVLLEELRTVLADDTTDPARLLREVTRLTTELEEHLAYEEQQLLPVLDELPMP
ncbi:nitroreductase/quinone reductase family protein [Streptomyces oceani]|uniref:Cation-binding protein n=1 Tax=Streptomyces oceani TaxID=1075402 RepID=A0A1E7KJP2_9ACTN|nr:nitroreductase/quinone reductase family protein [Streptomyces oceani]OEV04064.1 cation-binding protein [Streptomyces oceani]